MKREIPQREKGGKEGESAIEPEAGASDFGKLDVAVQLRDVKQPVETEGGHASFQIWLGTGDRSDVSRFLPLSHAFAGVTDMNQIRLAVLQWSRHGPIKYAAQDDDFAKEADGAHMKALVEDMASRGCVSSSAVTEEMNAYVVTQASREDVWLCRLQERGWVERLCVREGEAFWALRPAILTKIQAFQECSAEPVLVLRKESLTQMATGN